MRPAVGVWAEIGLAHLPYRRVCFNEVWYLFDFFFNVHRSARKSDSPIHPHRSESYYSTYYREFLSCYLKRDSQQKGGVARPTLFGWVRVLEKN